LAIALWQQPVPQRFQQARNPGWAVLLRANRFIAQRIYWLSLCLSFRTQNPATP
jgi:hypothetical protein